MTTKTTERPIIFSGPMVRAILEGRKSQTRRVVKPQPNHVIIRSSVDDEFYDADCIHEGKLVKPRYRVGDRLWVKETWQYTDESINETPGIVYRATDRDWESMEGWKWKSPLFMPRSASRLTLEIADVRVQRVQEISGRDCAAEGCKPDWEAFEDATCCQDGWEEPEEFISECEEECDDINFGNRLVHSSEHKEWERNRLNYALRLAYRELWDSLNAKRGFGWEANPWVWAITFKVV